MTVSLFEQLLMAQTSSTRLRLLEVIKRAGAISRADLVKKMKKPRTTIYDNLHQMEILGLIEKFTYNDGKRGRPITMWRLKK